jgi:hypothetical protein
MDIALMGNTLLRSAIRQNLVSFPSQIPTLMRRQGGDVPERVVQLYFLRGWSVRNICERYRLNKAMVQKLLSEWRIRAVSAGYIQGIHPESLEALARTHEEPVDDERLQGESACGESDADNIFDVATPVWVAAPSPQVDHVESAVGAL